MNGWDVLSDAIKIGLPSVVTGFTAFFIARWARTHDFEKERRRRKQDYLEKVVSDFDNFLVLLQEVLKLTMARNNKSLPEAARNVIEQELSETMKLADEAHVQLGRLPGKLRLMNFDECADKLQRFDLQATLFKRKLILSHTEGKIESLAHDFQLFNGDAHEFRQLVKRRYSDL